ncbi:MAG: nucleoside-diphosphate kinase, nucleoside-diphosphate kinase [Candidatus Peregrinibacteria bacterium GW2011_GWF2_39_17]|nr:MAG: nucleoside-diphosphate kinase, nucleoside-diphosphate kinase [Candidatus Peregrinibacteria bacterium GW2011_GWF2_39_17]HCW32491.1 nucleoside-diphosphate kinase [Candidatus Peregrinibacteria bacterium]
MERTLILIKPDAIQRSLVGEIINRFERKGLKIVALKMISLDEAILREHYTHIADKNFYPGLEKWMMSSPVIAMCVEGYEVVNTVRLLTGITKARSAEAGSIRGDFAMSVSCNVIHASDSIENAIQEVKRFFKPDELFDYQKSEFEHVYGEDERT